MMNQLAKKVFDNAHSKGFWDEYNEIMERLRKGMTLNHAQIESIKFAFSCQRLMLIVSELGEMVEAKRIGKKANWEVYEKLLKEKGVDFDAELFKQLIKDSPEDEFADSIIRHMDMAGGEGIDIQKHISHKMRYNALRERLHGKSF